MQTPLQITYRGIDPSTAIEEKIRKKAKELERYHDRITSCHVTVETEANGQQKGHLYSVHLDIQVPGHEVVVSKEHRFDHAHEDAYVAVRDAFDAAARQLETVSGKKKR